MLPDYQPLFKKYNNQLKPLISEIEGRLEKFEQPLLLNLASVFDYLSIAAVAGLDSEDSLQNADKVLDLCISQSYMSLIYAIRQNTDKFEKNVGKKGLRKLKSGHFVGRYSELRKKRTVLLKEASKMNELAALPLFQEAYEVALEMETMMNQEQPNLCLIHSESSTCRTTLIKWILSIVISVAVGLLVKFYIG